MLLITLKNGYGQDKYKEYVKYFDDIREDATYINCYNSGERKLWFPKN